MYHTQHVFHDSQAGLLTSAKNFDLVQLLFNCREWRLIHAHTEYHVLVLSVLPADINAYTSPKSLTL